MTARPFVHWPDRRLRTAAAPVGEISDAVRAVWDDMIDSMRAMPGHGVGLAAPQIGVMLRLAVVDAGGRQTGPVRLADPEILSASSETAAREEASPCFPGHSAKVTRPVEVRVGYTDAAGARVEEDFSGLWATSVQHQIDHLNGQMFFDRLSRTKRDMLLRRARKVAG